LFPFKGNDDALELNNERNAHQGCDELNTRRGASPADAPPDPGSMRPPTPLNPDAAENAGRWRFFRKAALEFAY